MAVVVLVLLVAPAVRAHQTSVKYVDLAIVDDTHVAVSIRFAPGDVTEAVGVPADARPTADAVAGDARVPPYVQAWIALAGCTNERPSAHVIDASFVAVSYTAACSPRTARARELSLDFAGFFALDARHEAIVRMTAPGSEAIRTIVRADEPRVTLRAGEAPSLVAWVRTGMDHIYGGIDHVLFVLALLLVVMLAPGTPRGDWHVRAFTPTLRSTAVVITSFTVAHSITLIAAALGVVELPSAFVEAMIALSIAYTAAEDVIKPDVRWRFALTFAFGLIHGLGFASTLAGLLPPADVVVPLLCFNLGVEVGQLSIVVVVLPILWLVARRIGARRYRRVLLGAIAAPIFIAGVAMVVDRVMRAYLSALQ